MRLAAILAVAALIASACASSGVTVTSKDGSVMEATEIKGIGDQTTVLTGSAHIRLVDRKAGSVFEARARTITIVQFARKQQKNAPLSGPATLGPTGLSSIKSVDFVGPVKISYDRPRQVAGESGQVSKVTTRMEGDADSARYDGEKQTAYLTGNVTLTQTDPTLYDGPAVATAQEVEINMKPNPGPEEVVFRINTPGGVSRIEVTPRSPEETPAK